MPPVLGHAVGASLGRLFYLSSARFRRDTKSNLALAVPGATLGQRLAVSAGAGRAAFEALRTLVRPVPESLSRIREAPGWSAVEAALDAGHGVLVISPHLGCFEILGPLKGTRPLTALYRPNRSPLLQSVIEQGRSRYARLAPVTHAGVRAVLGALKHGEMVLILPDQVPGEGDGVWEPFFGRPAYTMTLAARLSEVAGVRTFMFCGEILPRGAGVRLHFLEPDPPLRGDTRSRVAAINRNVERLALRHVDQYLWGYNRYKVPKGVSPP